MARFLLLLWLVAAAPLAAAADGARYLADNSILGELPAVELVHDYGASSLIVGPPEELLPHHVRSRLHRLPPLHRVGFRSWQAAASGPASLGFGDQAIVVLALIGPVDQRWLDELAATGIRILAPAHPHALVVRAGDSQLAAAIKVTTSTGIPVVHGLLPLPVAARLSRDLHPLLDGPAKGAPLALRCSYFGPRQRPDTRLELAPATLRTLLADELEIAFIEPVYPIELHNNLAAQGPLVAVDEVWSELGYNGRDMVIAHNDTGVDLSHPDLPPAAIRATIGVMRYTDTGHGTHTAASLAGRGTVPAPTNSSGCGDLLAGLPDLRGMAWGATLVVNNIVEGGLAEVGEMMSWAAAHGATLSSNSWGHGSPAVPVTGYTRAAVAMDAAVRDADWSTAENEAMSIFISAGNNGPAPSSVSAPATAKNVVTVGASQNLRCGSWIPAQQAGPDAWQVVSSSSRGPSQGRIKPDLVAPGSDLLSAESRDVEATAPWDQAWTGDGLSLGTGTSMACPIAAGAAAVFSEARWRMTGVMPSPALIKAALINGATDLGLAHEVQGWGRLNLVRSLQGPAGGEIHFLDQQQLPQLTTGERWQQSLEIASTAAPLSLTLVWTDLPGEADADHPLVNDLDLLLMAPDGTVFRGNRFAGRWSAADPGSGGDRSNPVENIFIATPVAGTWQLEVVAVNVAGNPPGLHGQDFAVVAAGDVSLCQFPDPPRDLSAVAVAANTVELRWTPAPAASAYRISRSTTPGGHPYSELATIAAPADAWHDDSVHGGIEYFYAIELRIDDCWSGYSAEAATVATGACRLPPQFAGLESLSDRQAVGCELALAWQPATTQCGGPLSYQVYRSPSPDFSADPGALIATGVTGNSFVDRGLQDGANWHYLVRAVDDANLVADDNQVSRTAAPSGPVDIWFADDGEDGDHSWRHGPASAADTDHTSWQLSGVDPHSPGHAWFCADAAQVSDRALRLAEPLELPSAPALTLELWHRHVLQERRDGGRLEYSVDGGRSWQDILAGDGFAIPANPDRFVEGAYDQTLARGGSANPLAGEAGWTGRSKGWVPVSIDLADFAGWQLLLRWRLGCDDTVAVAGGWWLDDIRIVHQRSCQACVPPPTPSGVLATATESGVELSWQSVDGAVAFQVARGMPGGPYLVIADTDGATTRFLDTTASGGTSYGYVVRSRLQCLSDDSAEATATAVGPCTAAPEFWGVDEVAARAGRECALELCWQEATGACADSALAYRIYRASGRAVEPVPGALYRSVVDELCLTDHAVADGDSMSYLVRAVDLANGREDRNLRALEATARGAAETTFHDDVESGGAAWTQRTVSAADRDGEPWVTTGDRSHSPATSWFVSDQPTVKDQALVLAAPLMVPTSATPQLEFWHFFDLDLLWDGGRLEYSLDGDSWHDILDGAGQVAANPDRITEGGYSATLQVGTGTNPLAGQRCWSGWVDNWLRVRVDLGDFRGHELWLRWRLATDDTRARTGWWVDDIRVWHTLPCGTRVGTAPQQVRGRRP